MRNVKPAVERRPVMACRRAIVEPVSCHCDAKHRHTGSPGQQRPYRNNAAIASSAVSGNSQTSNRQAKEIPKNGPITAVLEEFCANRGADARVSCTRSRCRFAHALPPAGCHVCSGGPAETARKRVAQGTVEVQRHARPLRMFHIVVLVFRSTRFRTGRTVPAPPGAGARQRPGRVSLGPRSSRDTQRNRFTPLWSPPRRAPPMSMPQMQRRRKTSASRRPT